MESRSPAWLLKPGGEPKLEPERIIIGLVVREIALEANCDGGRRVSGDAGMLVAGRDDQDPRSSPASAVCTTKSGCSRTEESGRRDDGGRGDMRRISAGWKFDATEIQFH